MPTFPWILIAFRFLWEAKTTLSIKLFCIIISWLDPDMHWDNSHCIQWKFRVISISQHLTKNTQTIKLLSYLLHGFKTKPQNLPQTNIKETQTTPTSPNIHLKGNWPVHVNKVKVKKVKNKKNPWKRFLRWAFWVSATKNEPSLGTQQQ